ncbi:MAG: beta-ketoacyl synthase chain length factor [Bacteroidales bacterium]|nr:MAG: beta-ketoacyl synthase chain length factor [Bacteroidales bacterium]
MEVFIRATGNISPQETYDNTSFLGKITEHEGPFLKCVEPDYRQILPKEKLPRRLSRSIKMGITAAGICLQDAGLEMPDAIITGTGNGMLADTERFLTTMLDNDEKLLNPTSFIQSTHNTIGAHIAVMLKCNRYNFTYVHGCLSFEAALLNSMFLLEEDPSKNILVGGIDELTEQHYQIKMVNRKFKETPYKHMDLLNYQSEGAIPGEGATFFLLTRRPGNMNIATIKGLETFYKPANTGEIADKISAFLVRRELDLDTVDLVILGYNGDGKAKEIYDELGTGYLKNKGKAYYKHLCGEYPTSSAFAVWLAANIIKQNYIPGSITPDTVNTGKPVRTVLLYNHDRNVNHSLILLSAC